MVELLHQLASGLALGGVYAVTALALVMIFQATQLVNFAQGEMAMFSTYVAWSLIDNGWSQHFQAQLNDADLELIPVRVVAVHRDALEVAGPALVGRVIPFVSSDGSDDDCVAVGDWLLLEAATHRPLRLLERRSVFRRKSAGTGRRVQLIAANVDTLGAMYSIAFSPTGTVLDSPGFTACIPRRSPSVEDMATARTQLLPRCCCTSATTISPLSRLTVRA